MEAVSLRLKLEDGREEQLVFHNLQSRFGNDDQLKHDEENLLKLGLKEAIRNHHNLLVDYCTATSQSPLHKQQTWHPVVRLLRNAFSHDMRWGWPKNVDDSLSYECEDAGGMRIVLTLDKAVLDGSVVDLKVIPATVIYALCDDMLQFAQTLA
jgi:hypothetical protein